MTVVGVVVVKSIVMQKVHDEGTTILRVIGDAVVVDDIFEAEDVGDGSFIKPHLTIILDQSLLIGGDVSAIALHSHGLVGCPDFGN